ncbi:hypothetical protein MKX03_015294 [Papaver bracteatum]|nr:hypothetical protein MKX03_015294 [Papaver bracteatum]
MAQNLADLREELYMFLSTKYDEVFKTWRTIKKKVFSTTADLLTVIYKEGEQMIGEMYQYAKPVFNIVKIRDLVHRIHSNSKR